MIHNYLGKDISYNLIYKKRKSIKISIDLYGQVEVQAPKGMSIEQVHQFLETKWTWIQEKTKEMKDRSNGPQEKIYEQGESFLYLGNAYPIKILQDQNLTQAQVKLENGILYILVNDFEEEKIRQALKRFYYQQCKALVEKSMKAYQTYFKVKPKSIRINDSSRTWGTCDSNQQLTFNWKLAMAPQKVIDYVVVHEMCHLVHLNHDRSFWRLVGKIMPDYKEQENWLAFSSWKMTV